MLTKQIFNEETPISDIIEFMKSSDYQNFIVSSRVFSELLPSAEKEQFDVIYDVSNKSIYIKLVALKIKMFMFIIGCF